MTGWATTSATADDWARAMVGVRVIAYVPGYDHTEVRELTQAAPGAEGGSSWESVLIDDGFRRSLDEGLADLRAGHMRALRG